jgi:hypothetical protein
MTTHITKTWFDGEKVVTQEIPESEVYKQKPVAWFHEEKYKTHFTTDPSEDMIGKYWQPLYTTPPTVSIQEPVGEVLNERGEVDYISYVPPVGTPLYTAPQSINEFKPDWDAMAVMVEEQQRMAKRIEELETYKRLYELRGKALERPCTNCGHQPAKIKTMEQPEQHEQTLMDALIGGTGVMLGDKRIDPASIYKQPEQEPVSFNHDIGSDRFKVVRGAFWWHVLIGDSPTEHGKFRSRAGAEKMAADLLREFRNGAFVQHTSPRQWQGLTDDEIAQVRHLYDGTAGWTIERFAKQIEAKLKEKNNG